MCVRGVGVEARVELGSPEGGLGHTGDRKLPHTPYAVRVSRRRTGEPDRCAFRWRTGEPANPRRRTGELEEGVHGDPERKCALPLFGRDSTRTSPRKRSRAIAASVLPWLHPSSRARISVLSSSARAPACSRRMMVRVASSCECRAAVSAAACVVFSALLAASRAAFSASLCSRSARFASAFVVLMSRAFRAVSRSPSSSGTP